MEGDREPCACASPSPPPAVPAPARGLGTPTPTPPRAGEAPPKVLPTKFVTWLLPGMYLHSASRATHTHTHTHTHTWLFPFFLIIFEISTDVN